jgi:hypothetical protein
VPTHGTFLRSGGIGIRYAQITDGLSNTLMVGEKHVPLGYFGQGPLDCSAYNGDQFLSHARPAGPAYPLAQTLREITPVYGSYHTAVVQFAYCDGSVHSLYRTLDPVTLGLLADRDDGQPLPDY